MNNGVFYTITERYFSYILKDPFRLIFLILQPLIITVLFSVVFKNSQNTDTFKLLLVITAIWFGLINSCQEIVKDRALYIVENRFGVNAFSFLLSRQVVLSIIAFFQMFFILFGLYLYTSVKFCFFGYFMVLFIVSLSSIALGLMISSFSKGPAQAVAIAPILTIPQILFNNTLIDRAPVKIVDYIRDLMISNWALLFMERIDDKYDFKALSYVFLILVYGLIYIIMGLLFIRKK